MMKQFSFTRPPVIFIALLYIATACKSPETTIVRQSPTPPAPDPVAQQDTTAAEPSATFRQINIAEINLIPTLDPLFAENAGTMRALQLVYEGLVRYDQNGSVIPGLVKNWTLSPDSLTYRFTLRDDVYYHDSNAFNSGRGRKLVARDVKYIFERMAKLTVPDNAAQLFMDIKGFEPYYREQHNVFNPAKRVLDGISGIQTPNDSTVVFELVQKGTHFLQKLASPYAVIYPREAITDNDPTKFKAVGAGPFTLSQQRGDSLYIFSKFENYYNSEQPAVNRVDVTVRSNESSLLKALAGGDIHVLPKPGLQIMQEVLNKEGSLTSNYAERYTLAKPGGETKYVLHFNTQSDLNQRKAKQVVALFDSTGTFENLPGGFIRFESYAGKNTASGFTSGDTLAIANTNDSYSRRFIAGLRNKLQQQGAALQILDVYTPTRKTGLYMTHYLPFYPNQNMEIPEEPLVSFSVPHRAIYRSAAENIQFNDFPWWIDLRSATVPSIDNQ